MKTRHFVSGAAILPLLLGGCAVTPPTGPSIVALPGDGKTYEQFQQDDYNCRAVASQGTGYASAAARQNGTGAAVTGTAVGAAAGALLGAAAGNAGKGAAIGAGTGLAVGAAQGAANVHASSDELQWRYDATYAQCMTAAGNKLPEPPPEEAYGDYPDDYYYYPGYGYYYAYPPVIWDWGWGWGGWGWRGGGWHGGWRGGGWHGGGWHGGGGGWHGGGGGWHGGGGFGGRGGGGGRH